METTSVKYTDATLSGDTFRFRSILRTAGWQYDGETKTWRKPVEAGSTPEDVLRRVRGLGGIRNRGNLSVAIA